MPQYVYGLHDFEPENADEIPFRIGEKIEVLEKDDVYQDGWWTGRVADGKSGLFPQSYTSPIPPTLTSTISHDDTQSETTPTLQDNTLAADSTPGNMTAPLPSISLQTLTEEPESHTVTPDGRDHSAGVQGEGGENGDAEMMRATMTDVQQAIEQLGRTNDRDGSRSFSFASSHGDYTDRELTETENETDGDADGDGVGENEVPWHRGVREKLAERARKDNEERMARESRDREESVPSTPMRSTAPPIDVELSDESDADDEDEEHRGSHSQTVAARRMSGKRASDPMPSPRYPHIPEESEDEQSSPEKEKKTEAPPPISAVIGASRSLGAIPVSLLSATTESGHIIPSEDFIVPIPDDTDLPTATPEQLTFPRASPTMPVPVSAPAQIEASTSNLSETPIASPTPLRSVASGQNIVTSLSKTPSPPPAVTAPESAIPTATMVTNPSSAPPMKSVPSAIRVAKQLSFAVGSALPSPSLSSNGSVGIQQTLTTPATTAGASVKTTVGGTPPPTSSLNPLSSQSGIATEVDLHPSTKKHPSEWSVEEVIEWLKSKGFDQGVCDKFEEQEITGDVLLELDANVLKAEIGIVAFGKRIRIVNAINELKRPPSITDSEPKAPVPQMMGGVSMLGMGGTSRSHSISYSHSHSASMQSSTHHSFNNLNTAGGSSSLAFPLPQSLSPALSNSLVMPGSPSHLTMGGNSSAGTQGGFNPPYSAGLGSMLSNDSSPLTSEFPAPPPLSSSQSQGMFGLGRNGGSGWRASDPGIDEVERVSTRSFVGLGFATGESSSNGRVLKQRVAHPSPSDGALKASAMVEKNSSTGEERGVISDSETTQVQDSKSKRRRLFGLSSESTSIKEKASSIKESTRRSRDVGSPAPSSSPSDTRVDSKSMIGSGIGTIVGMNGEEVVPTRRHSKKRSTDERKASDRLSLFGSSFPSGLGKSRKPAPRLSSSNDNEKTEKSEKSEKSSTFATLSRIRHVGDRKSSGRPSISESHSKDKEKEKGASIIASSSSEKGKQKGHDHPSVLRKRTLSMSAESLAVRPAPTTVQGVAGGGMSLKPGKSILEQIGTPDHNGWMRKKGDHYNTWKLRYFVLKGPHLYCLRSNNASYKLTWLRKETKIKGYINIVGYRVYADENVDPGRYGFRIVHDTDKTHYFSSEEQSIIREWMKALMKATISRDYTNPVVSSSNIPTIPLVVAQAMNPAPRPPSPGAREATQRAHRRDNPNQLSSRDAQVLLMGLPSKDKSPSVNGQTERTRLESFFSSDSVSITAQDQTPKKPLGSPKTVVPPRPSRETRRFSTNGESPQGLVDAGLIEWANSHLPQSLHITDPLGPLCGGLALLRLAEDIKGTPSSPPVPDSAFPSGPNDDRLDGLFRLFDFLLDNDVKMGTVSINDIRQGKKEKIVQLMKALKAWEEKRKAIAQSIGKSTIVAGPFMGMAGPIDFH